MFEAIIYNTHNNVNLKVWRSKTFNTFSAAQDWVDGFAAIDLDEYEDSSEFEELGEYSELDLYYEIIGR
jgi:hypothetical protein